VHVLGLLGERARNAAAGDEEERNCDGRSTRHAALISA
jgi:hypothetical protein